MIFSLGPDEKVRAKAVDQAHSSAETRLPHFLFENNDFGG